MPGAAQIGAMLPGKAAEEARRIRQGGPAKYREKLKEEGKLFVRERLKLFFPGGPEFEDGLFAAQENPETPADGIVTGAGVMEGRRVFFTANDYTVKAGSLAERAIEKLLRTQERALRARKPILYLVDSSGARIDKQASFFAQNRGAGRIFYNHSLLSGVVPQICVMYGPCVAGAAYTPVFCDFTVMVRGMSAMCIASPRMVEMVTGEKIDMQALGGADMHMKESGSCDLVVDTEEQAASAVKRILSYLPDDCRQRPPAAKPRPPANGAKIEEIVPENPNKPFDMLDFIRALVDEDSFLEVKPGHAAELVTGFARLEGRAVGIVANQPMVRAGAIFPESSEKAAEFIWKCDAFHIPLLYLADTPGFMVGSVVERRGILRRGRKFIYATSMATVPKLSVVVRKCYGAGLYAMAGGAYEPEAVLALPGAAIAIMGPEAAINAVYFNKIKDLPGAEREKRVKELQEEYRRDIDIQKMAGDLIVDHIVEPGELREELVRRYAFFEEKEFPLPERKHGAVF